jgi:hypothetical protein
MPLDARFAQFRQDVTGALEACIKRHDMEQDPFFKTRSADTRKRLQEEADEARDLAKRLRDFTSKYVIRHPTMILRPGRVFDLGPIAQDLDALASYLDDTAADVKDKGGPTRKTAAFDVLAEELIRAYSRATKRKGTGGNVREGRSRLRALVEAVLPPARKIAKDATGQSLKAPASGGLGDRLAEIAERLQRGVQPPRA